MDALLSLQDALNNGVPVDFQKLDSGYYVIYDEPNGGQRFSYPKIVNGEVQALAIFGLVDSIEGVPCFSVGYAVSKNHRGCGLAVESVNKGVAEMKAGFGRTPMRSFYIEAVIDVTNAHSIEVAEKLFPGPAVQMRDHYSGTPSLYFKKLIAIR